MTAVPVPRAPSRSRAAAPLCFAVALLEGYDIQAIGKTLFGDGRAFVTLLLRLTYGLTLLVCAAAAGSCILGAPYSLNGVTPMYYPAASRGLATGAPVAMGRLGPVAGPLVAGQLPTLDFTAGGVAAAMAPAVIVAGAAATFMTLRAGLHEL